MILGDKPLISEVVLSHFFTQIFTNYFQNLSGLDQQGFLTNCNRIWTMWGQMGEENVFVCFGSIFIVRI
jgi:hypothetical protein